MKAKSSNPFLSLAVIAMATAMPASLRAAIFTWDSDGVFSNGVTPGSGTWSTTNTNWNNGTADVGWANGNAATFSGADGGYAITLGGALTAGANNSGTGAGLVFLNGTNNISAASALILTVPTSNSSGAARTTANSAIWVAADKTATIGDNVTLAMTGSNFGQGVALDSGATLNISPSAKIDKTTNANRDLLFGGVTGAANPSTLNVFGSIARSVATDTAALAFGVWGGTLNVDVEDGGVISTASDGSANNNGSIVVGQTSGPVGVLNIKGGTTGGTVISSNSGTHAQSGLKLAKDSGSSGTVNLDGGSLSTFKVFQGTGTGTFNFNGGTLKPVATNNTNFMTGLTSANVLAGGALIDSNGFDVTIGQALLDGGTGGGLTKTGAGTLTLSGLSSYTGTTNVNGGVLAVGFTGTLVSNIAVNSGGAFTGSGLTSGSLTFNSGSTLIAQTTEVPFLADSVVFAGATTLNFSGAVANGTTYDLLAYGSGGVIPSSNAALAATLSSTFRVAINNDTGAGKVTGTVTTGTRTWNTTNGTWQVGGAATPWLEGDKKYFNGDSVVFGNPASASTVNLVGALIPSAVSVTNSANAYTFSGTGSISGPTSLTKAGSGSLLLETANTYTGLTEVNAGTLVLNGSLSGTAITVASGASLTEGSTGVIAGAASLGVSGTVVLAGANTYTGATAIATGGSLQLGDGATDGSITSSTLVNDGILTFNTLGTQTFPGAISGVGSLTKQGDGALTLSSTASTWSGGATVSAGTVSAPTFGGTTTTSIVSIASGATVNFTGGLTANTVTGAGNIVDNTGNSVQITGDHSGFTGTLTASGGNTQLNTSVSGSPSATYNHTGGEFIFAGATGGPADYTVKLGSFASNSTVRGANTGVSGAGTVTLEIGHLGTDTTLSGGVQNGGGAASKALALAKVGSGKLTLQGNKTYTGATTVNAGILQVSGLSASSGVTVSGGSFAGTGTVVGAVIVNSAGNISPGSPVGALSVGATVIHGSYVCEVSGATTDTLAVTGNLDITGATLNLSALTAPTAAEYVIATYTGTLSGTFTVGTPLAGYNVDYGTTGQIKLVGAGGAAYSAWATGFGLNPAGDGAANVDKEGDGFENGTEYMLGGSPVSGSNNPKIYALIADSSADADTTNELIMTIVVPQGTPVFPAGSPTSSVIFQGFTVTVRGSTNLASFPVTVMPVNPVTTGLPAAPVQGGVTYEYRSFSLGESNGITGKGFLQVTVTNP